MERAYSYWENKHCQIICHSKILCLKPPLFMFRMILYRKELFNFIWKGKDKIACSRLSVLGSWERRAKTSKKKTREDSFFSLALPFFCSRSTTESLEQAKDEIKQLALINDIEYGGLKMMDLAQRSTKNHVFEEV